MPLFAGNDGNVRAQSTLTRFGFFNNIYSNVSADAFIPKLNSAIYFSRIREGGSVKLDAVNIGISPRIKLENGLMVLFNAQAEHQGADLSKNWRSKNETVVYEFDKTRVLDFGLGTGFIFKNFFASVQFSNILESKSYYLKNASPDSENPRSIRRWQMAIGKSHASNEEFSIFGSVTYSGPMVRSRLAYSYSTTLKYKWIIGAVSYSTRSQLRLALGSDIGERWGTLYGYTASTSRIGRGSSRTHQLGVAFNITKLNAEHQLIPLLSVF